MNPIRWYKNKRNWWKDRGDSPVYRRELREISASVRLAAAQPEATSWRPILRGKLPQPDGEGPVLLACCDEGYFYRFGRQLAISCILADPALRIHLHIYDPLSLCIADAEFLEERLGPRLTISMEGPERNPYLDQNHSAYFYAAGRFAVAAEVQRHCNAPIMVVDVDGVVRRDTKAEFEKLTSCDVGLIMRPSSLRPWRRVLACAVFINATENGKSFVRDLGAAISLAQRSCPHHHVDQTALHELVVTRAEISPSMKIASLDLLWGDHTFSEESIIWSAKGGRKQSLSGISLRQARAVMGITSV